MGRVHSYACMVFFFFMPMAWSRTVIFKQPVTDLFFEQLSLVYGVNADDGDSLESVYRDCPLYATTAWGCRRAIQALFNEVYEVIEERGDELCIAASHLFYDAIDRRPEYRTPRGCIFWVLKDAVLDVNDVPEEALASIPSPISFCDPKSVEQYDVLTLVMPWHDSVTQRTYSAGTRFVRMPDTDTDDFFAVRLLDTQMCTAKKSFIPRDCAYVIQKNSQQKKQQDFVALLKLWVYRCSVIPYVWGGSSVVDVLPNDEFQRLVVSFLGQEIELWYHASCGRHKTGLDCSLMILRAAQACGIPYFYKNSHTLCTRLCPLGVGEELQEGDIMWYSGHVMVVSDLENNMLIESCGYPLGYGKVHEIELEKRFVGIKAYDDLLIRYHDREPLCSRYKDGKSGRCAHDVTIFKFASIF